MHEKIYLFLTFFDKLAHTHTRTHAHTALMCYECSFTYFYGKKYKKLNINRDELKNLKKKSDNSCLQHNLQWKNKNPNRNTPTKQCDTDGVERYKCVVKTKITRGRISMYRYRLLASFRIS